MSINNQTGKNEIDQIIASEFGVNANYVADLFQQFEKNPQSVDEEWREFFDELLGGAEGEATHAPVTVQATSAVRAEEAPIQHAGAAVATTESSLEAPQPAADLHVIAQRRTSQRPVIRVLHIDAEVFLL